MYKRQHRAIDTFNNFQPDIVIGSSRGGAIASYIDTADISKILVAPAWSKFGVTSPLVNETTTILHSKQDNLVQLEDSFALVEHYGCKLIECGIGHRMSDEEALQELLKVVLLITNANR